MLDSPGMARLLGDMAATERENVPRAVRFEKPERVPMIFHVGDACRRHYRRDILQELPDAMAEYSTYYA